MTLSEDAVVVAATIASSFGLLNATLFLLFGPERWALATLMLFAPPFMLAVTLRSFRSSDDEVAAEPEVAG